MLTRLNTEFVKALRSPDLQPKFDGMGVVVIANSPEEFRQMYMAGFDVYGKIIKAANIRIE